MTKLSAFMLEANDDSPPNYYICIRLSTGFFDFKVTDEEDFSATRGVS
jgi:hypothetical protein